MHRLSRSLWSRWRWRSRTSMAASGTPCVTAAVRLDLAVDDLTLAADHHAG